MIIVWVLPLPSKSHLFDSYIFSRGCYWEGGDLILHPDATDIFLEVGYEDSHHCALLVMGSGFTLGAACPTPDKVQESIGKVKSFSFFPKSFRTSTDDSKVYFFCHQVMLILLIFNQI